MIAQDNMLAKYMTENRLKPLIEFLQRDFKNCKNYNKSREI